MDSLSSLLALTQLPTADCYIQTHAVYNTAISGYKTVTNLGDTDGFSDVFTIGESVGFTVGTNDGDFEGDEVTIRAISGFAVGFATEMTGSAATGLGVTGLTVGFSVGDFIGFDVGSFVVADGM